MKAGKLQIGITGGIGSGKSLVCKIFSCLGIAVYDADTRAKWLANNDAGIRAKVMAHFGEEAFTKEGLNRSFISKVVFNDKSQLEKLNGIIHPAVGQDYKEWVSLQKSKYVVKEAALMFESGSYKALDKVINVSAPIDLRIDRVQQRDPFRSRHEIESIIDKQMDEQQRIGRSDYIINNDGVEMIIPQVLKLNELFIAVSRN